MKRSTMRAFPTSGLLVVLGLLFSGAPTVMAQSSLDETSSMPTHQTSVDADPLAALSPAALTPMSSQLLEPSSSSPSLPATTRPALPSPPPLSSFMGPQVGASAISLPVPAPAPTNSALTSVPPSAPTVSNSLLTKDVELASLSDIDPQSFGLLTSSEGGLGTAMWKGTDRTLIEHYLPALLLPLASPSLNALAERLLLTSAGPPPGNDGPTNLISSRVDRLLALGDTSNAWKMAILAKPGLVDDASMRETAEAAFALNAADVCQKLPSFIKNHDNETWQEIQLLCQLRDNDLKAAQLTLELLRSQGIKDELFFTLVEKNILGTSKILPRQLTPLRPIIYNLLSLTNLSLPGEIYSHPPASLVSSLVQTKTKDDYARLILAERSATAGILNYAGLALVYHSLAFSPEAISSATRNGDSDDPRLRSLLYQAALQEKYPLKRLEDCLKFIHVTDPNLLNGSAANLLAEMIDDQTMSPELDASSVDFARVYLLAKKPEIAFEWLKKARALAPQQPAIAASLVHLWPLVAFSGLETEDRFGSDLKEWLGASLLLDGEHGSHEKSVALMLLLEATGYNVAQENWVKVAGSPVFEKRLMPPALLLERLRDASQNGRRGETVLLSLLLAGAGTTDVSPIVMIETVRALRLVGLTAEASDLAKEAAIVLLASPPVKI